MRRQAPRSLDVALNGLTARLAPASVLGRVQEVWDRTVGPAIASSARPTAERGGVLTIVCDGAVWSQELDLMAGDLLAALNDALGEAVLRELRCRTS